MAHYDFADQPKRRAVSQNDIDAGDGRAVADETSLYLFVARAAYLPGVAVAVVETPGATFVRRQGPGKRDAHAMIVRGKVAFAFAVAIAQFQELARAVDAQSFDHIARPAVAIGLSGQAPFGREHATAAHRGNVALEVNLVAEQAESVLDLPLDMGSGAGCRLRVDRLSTPGQEHKEEADHKERAHGISRDRPMRRDMISMADAAEM
ncbi:MAG: hypothetical protein E6G76_16065 [Alphaproteobacteria bacterium]|nr:MAG: hypothetical protein E6G76_16065 [Alphaproteobacteria bacterium]